ncbi:hypothetical protein Emed_006442 [Eimeria media]
MGAAATTPLPPKRGRLFDLTAQLLHKPQGPPRLDTSSSLLQQVEQQLQRLGGPRLSSRAELEQILAGRLPLLLQIEGLGEGRLFQVWLQGWGCSRSGAPGDDSAYEGPQLQLVCLGPTQAAQLRDMRDNVFKAAAAEAAAAAAAAAAGAGDSACSIELPVLSCCLGSSYYSEAEVFFASQGLRVRPPPRPWPRACLWRQHFYILLSHVQKHQQLQQQGAAAAAAANVVAELPLRLWQVEWLRLQRLFDAALRSLFAALQQHQQQRKHKQQKQQKQHEQQQQLQEQRREQEQDIDDPECPYVLLASRLSSAASAGAAERGSCCCGVCDCQITEDGAACSEDMGSALSPWGYASGASSGPRASCMLLPDKGRHLMREAAAEASRREPALQAVVRAADKSEGAAAAAAAAAAGELGVAAAELRPAFVSPILEVVEEGLPALQEQFSLEWQEETSPQPEGFLGFACINKISRAARGAPAVAAAAAAAAAAGAEASADGGHKPAGKASLLLHANLSPPPRAPFLSCGSKTSLFLQEDVSNSSSTSSSSSSSSGFPPAHCCCIADVQVHTPSLLLQPSAAGRCNPQTSQRLLLHLHSGYLDLLEQQQQQQAEDADRVWTAAGEALLLRALWCCRVGEAATFQVYVQQDSSANSEPSNQLQQQQQRGIAALSIHLISVTPLLLRPLGSPSLPQSSSSGSSSGGKTSAEVALSTSSQQAPEVQQEPQQLPQLLLVVRRQRALLLLQRELQQFAAACIGLLLQQEDHPSPVLRRLLTCSCSSCLYTAPAAPASEAPPLPSRSGSYRRHSVSTAAAAARSLFGLAPSQQHQQQQQQQPQQQQPQQQHSTGKLMGLLMRGRSFGDRPASGEMQQQLQQQQSSPAVRSLSKQGIATTLRRLRSRSIDKRQQQQQQQQQLVHQASSCFSAETGVASAPAGAAAAATAAAESFGRTAAARASFCVSQGCPGEASGTSPVAADDLWSLCTAARKASLARFLSDFQGLLEGRESGNDEHTLRPWRRRLRQLLQQGVCVQGVLLQQVNSSRLWQQLQQEQRAAQAALWRQHELPVSPLFLLVETGGLRFFVCPAQSQPILPLLLQQHHVSSSSSGNSSNNQVLLRSLSGQDQLPLPLSLQRIFQGFSGATAADAATPLAAAVTEPEWTSAEEQLQQQQQQEQQHGSFGAPLALTSPLPLLPHATAAFVKATCADAAALEAAADPVWLLQQRLLHFMRTGSLQQQQQQPEKQQQQEQQHQQQLWGLVFESNKALPDFVLVRGPRSLPYDKRQQLFLAAAAAAATAAPKAAASGVTAAVAAADSQQHVWRPLDRCPHKRSHQSCCCACQAAGRASHQRLQAERFDSTSSSSSEGAFCHRCRVAAAPPTWPAAGAAAARVEESSGLPTSAHAVDSFCGEAFVWVSEEGFSDAPETPAASTAPAAERGPIEASSFALLPKATLKPSRCCNPFASSSCSSSSSGCCCARCSSVSSSCMRGLVRRVCEALLRRQLPPADGPALRAALRQAGVSSEVGLWLLLDELLLLLASQEPLLLQRWDVEDGTAAAAAAAAAALQQQQQQERLRLPESSSCRCVAVAAACTLIASSFKRLLRYEQQVCCSCSSGAAVCSHFSLCAAEWAFQGGAQRLLQSSAAAAASAAAANVKGVNEHCLLLFHRRLCASLAVSAIRADGFASLLLPLPLLLRCCLSAALNSPSVFAAELQQQQHALPLCRLLPTSPADSATAERSQPASAAATAAAAAAATGATHASLPWGRVHVKSPLPAGTACSSVLLLGELVVGCARSHGPPGGPYPACESRQLLVGAPLLNRWWLGPQGAASAASLPFGGASGGEVSLLSHHVSRQDPSAASAAPAPSTYKASRGPKGGPPPQLLTSEFVAAVPPPIRGGLVAQLLLRALAPPEPPLWKKSRRMQQQRQQQQQQQQQAQPPQPGFVVGRRLDSVSAAADDHLLQLLLQLLLLFDSWLGFSGLSDQQQQLEVAAASQTAERESAAAGEAGGAAGAAGGDNNGEGRQRFVSAGLEGGFCAPGSGLRQHQLRVFAALSNAVEGLCLIDPPQGPQGALLSAILWVLLLMSYCGCAVPDAALNGSGSSSSSSNAIINSLVESAAAATARVGVYADLLRVLRLRHRVCPLPVGPPHLVPRHLPLLPLLSVDKRVLPPDCRALPEALAHSAAAATAAAVQHQQQQHQLQQQLHGQPAVLAPSESARPTSPLARQQQQQASRLFGCTYTPKYPEQRHCHLPDPLLPPHVSCAIILYNLKRLGSAAVQWASAVSPKTDGADVAAELAVAAVTGPAAAAAAAAARIAAGELRGPQGSSVVAASESAVCPYVLKGENAEHVLQWLEWQQQKGPLLFSCGLNEGGALGLGPPVFFPLDPVLEERDNFLQAAKGADVWFCCQPQRIVSLPSGVKSVSAGLRNSTAVTAEGLLFTWGALDDSSEEFETSTSSSSSSSSAAVSHRRHPADHSRDFGLDEALRFSWMQPTAAAAISQAAAAEEQQNEEEGVSLPALLGGCGALSACMRGVSSFVAEAFASVCCGPDFCAAITESGCLYTWGSNSSGMLGLGDTRSRSQPTPVSPSRFTSCLPLQQQQQQVRQVACGNMHMAALTAAGCLFVWGSNSHGQCGLPVESFDSLLTPHELLLVDCSLLPLSSVSLAHSIVAAHKGDPDSSSSSRSSSNSSTTASSKGCLDLSALSSTEGNSPLLVADASGLSYLMETAGDQWSSMTRGLLRFSQAACGSLHTLVLGAPLEPAKDQRGPPSGLVKDAKGSPSCAGLQCLYTWGSNTSNCLGLAKAEAAAATTARAPPTRLPAAAFKRKGGPHQQRQQMPPIRQVAAGGLSSAALSETGDLWLWGDLQGFIDSGDSLACSASAPTLFGLSEEVEQASKDTGTTTSSSSSSSSGSRTLVVQRVAFAAEGARLLLFTDTGDLIAIGDGCVQQQLLRTHPESRQQQQQQEGQPDAWNAAAATVAPRFWADKSRRQRLRGACRIHVPHRKIVEAAAGLDHFLLTTLPQDTSSTLQQQQPLAFLKDLHRPPALLRCQEATPPCSGTSSSASSSSSSSSTSSSSSSSSTADGTRLSSIVSSGSSGASLAESLRCTDTPTGRPFASVRSHSAAPAGSSSSSRQLQQQPQDEVPAKQLWHVGSSAVADSSRGRSNSGSSSSVNRSLAAAARDAAATGLQLTLRHLASAGGEAAKAAAAKAADAAEKVVEGQVGSAVMEGLLDRIDRGSGAVLNVLTSGITYLLPGPKPAPGATAAAAAAAGGGAAGGAKQQGEGVGVGGTDSRVRGSSLVAAPPRSSGTLRCRPSISLGETAAAIAVPAVKVEMPRRISGMGASLRPLPEQQRMQQQQQLRQLQQQQQQQQQANPPVHRHLQHYLQQQRQQDMMYSLPPRSQSLTTLPSYREQQDPQSQQQLEAERQEAWKRLSSTKKTPATAAAATAAAAAGMSPFHLPSAERSFQPNHQQLSGSMLPLRPRPPSTLPDIPRRSHVAQQQQQQQHQQPLLLQRELLEQQQRAKKDSLRELLKSNTAPAVLHPGLSSTAAAQWTQQQQQQLQQLQQQWQQQQLQSQLPPGWATPQPDTPASRTLSQQQALPRREAFNPAAAAEVDEDDGVAQIMYYPQHDTTTSSISSHSAAAAAAAAIPAPVFSSTAPAAAWRTPLQQPQQHPQQQPRQQAGSFDAATQHLSIPSFFVSALPPGADTATAAAATAPAAADTYLSANGGVAGAGSAWQFAHDPVEMQQQHQFLVQQQQMQQQQQLHQQHTPPVFPPMVYQQQQQLDQRLMSTCTLPGVGFNGIDGLNASFLPQHTAAFMPSQQLGLAPPPVASASAAASVDFCSRDSSQSAYSAFQPHDGLEAVLLHDQQLLREMQMQQQQHAAAAAHGGLSSSLPTQQLLMGHSNQLFSQLPLQQQQQQQHLRTHPQPPFVPFAPAQYQHMQKQQQHMQQQHPLQQQQHLQQQQQHLLQQQQAQPMLLHSQQQVHGPLAWEYGGSTLPQQHHLQQLYTTTNAPLLTAQSHLPQQQQQQQQQQHFHR